MNLHFIFFFGSCVSVSCLLSNYSLTHWCAIATDNVKKIFFTVGGHRCLQVTVVDFLFFIAIIFEIIPRFSVVRVYRNGEISSCVEYRLFFPAFMLSKVTENLTVCAHVSKWKYCRYLIGIVFVCSVSPLGFFAIFAERWSRYIISIDDTMERLSIKCIARVIIICV